MKSESLNLLFICSRNQWRSPTAEQIWRRGFGINTRSAGTSPKARKTVGPTDIRWADVIFVMESKHKNRLMASYNRLLNHKSIYVLDIPDDYGYMDEELIEELKARVEPILDAHT